MLSFREYISEKTVYRGVKGKFDPNRKQDITWVSTSREHSEMYASGGEVVDLEINESRLDYLDLGFRASETEVKFDEVKSRFVRALMDRFKKKKISREKAIEIDDKLDELDYKGYKQVWEWIHQKEFLQLIKESGFNSIKQREGLVRHSSDVITYGILDKNLIKM